MDSNLTDSLQGCCISVESHDNTHATEGGLEEHRREASPTNETPAADAAAASGAPVRVVQGQRRRTFYPSQFPLGEHFNSPLRPHTWYSKRRTWSRAQLEQERKEFFETRVTGRDEVWAALSAAISFIRADDFATAQSMIDAVGVTVPTGDLCEGCYDEQGVLYRLPQCIVSDPENMVEDDSDSDFPEDDGLDPMSEDKLSMDEASGDELITEATSRRRDDKGKASERDLIKVQVRLSDRVGPDLVLSVGKNQSVSYIARRVREEAAVCHDYCRMLGIY